MTRRAYLRAFEAMLEFMEWDYIETEKRQYEGGFVPDDGSLRSDKAHEMLSLLRELIEAEGE